MDIESQEVIYCDDDDISISHTQREKYIRTKHTIKNPNFFDIDKIFNDCITNHKKI